MKEADKYVITRKSNETRMNLFNLSRPSNIATSHASSYIRTCPSSAAAVLAYSPCFAVIWRPLATTTKINIQV